MRPTGNRFDLKNTAFFTESSCRAKKSKKLDLPFVSFNFIMLSFNVGTLTFFARTAVIESAAQWQVASPLDYHPSRPGDRWQIQLTDETIEWLTKSAVVNEHSKSVESAMYRPWEVSVLPKDKALHLALDAWATALIRGNLAHQDTDSYEPAYTRISPVESYPSMKSQIKTSMVWSAEEEQEAEKTSSAFRSWSWRPKVNKKNGEDICVHHLIIRQIGPNLTEWMEIMQRTHKTGRDAKNSGEDVEVSLMLLDQRRVDQLRFVTTENGEKRLTDISHLFAQQRQTFLQDMVSGQFPVLQGASPTQCDLYRQEAQSRLEDIIQERRAKPYRFEFEQRNADVRDRVEEIRAFQEKMSAVSKESMPRQGDIGKIIECIEKQKRQNEQVPGFPRMDGAIVERMEEPLEDDLTAGLKSENEDVQSQLVTLKSEITSVKEQHEKNVEQHAEDERKLKQEIADLRNDVVVAQTALDQATDDHRKRKDELEAELASLFEQCKEHEERDEALNRDFDAERERLKTEKEKEKHDQMQCSIKLYDS